MSKEPTRTEEAQRHGGWSSPTHSDLPAREDDWMVGEDSSEVLLDWEVLGLHLDMKMETKTS
jgi:hypothetical protein